MTSSILLATDASNPQVVGSYNFASTAEEKGKLLPKPSGYRILCAIPEAEKEFEDSEIGLIKADETMRNEETLTTVLFVVDMGPDCYKDPEPKLPTDLPPGTPVTVLAARQRFPSGPWCKEGDTVLFSRYAGKRFTIEGVEFRMLSDDEITATIPDGAKVGGL